MKITIELDENLPDDEIRIHCRRMTEECFGYFVF